MDQNHFNTDEAVRKSGSHLTLAERGMIQALHREGMSLRDIAKNIGCAHTTISYELKRGTPPRKCNRGRIPSVEPLSYIHHLTFSGIIGI